VHELVHTRGRGNFNETYIYSFDLYTTVIQFQYQHVFGSGFHKLIHHSSHLFAQNHRTDSNIAVVIERAHSWGASARRDSCTFLKVYSSNVILTDDVFRGCQVASNTRSDEFDKRGEVGMFLSARFDEDRFCF